MKFKQVTLNASLLRDIANRLDSSFGKYINMLSKTRQYILGSSQVDWSTFRDYRSMIECSRIMPGYLR
ncbi:unnamed protein product [Gongylonema pulchrum]|nr:unnamed protein product [Gongylonema pulchrum]